MATYVPAPEIESVMRNLQRRYSHSFGELNFDKVILLWELDAKFDEEKNQPFAVTKKIDKALKVQYPDKDYVVIIFRERWDAKTPAQQNLTVMDCMYKMDWEGEKIRKPDVVEFFEIASAFGIDWKYNDLARDPLGEEKIEVIANPNAPKAKTNDEDED